ncbi:MAG TPA: haloalkane dehalogenase [Acidimicrobiia bacterium]|nr:haloalkane dehalogenase [Acidimicrobiia bacterium]
MSERRGVVRTPEERFAVLPGYPFEPNYVELADAVHGPLRMHYVDEGPRDADPVLLLHGQPTWSYLYRKVIAALVSRGHRAVAPDYIGYGRSDKIVDKLAYSFPGHIEWLRSFVEALDLRRITLVVQDWGGPLGLAVLAAEPDRFARVVAANTILHTADPALAGRLEWALHALPDAPRVVVEEALLDYILASQRYPLVPSELVQYATLTNVPADVLAAYDAPFPDETYKGGLRQTTVLIPITRNDVGAEIDRNTFATLRSWERPFLTAYSDGDPPTRGWDALFREVVPGADGQPHTTIAGAGHFLQEDRGEELGAVVADFISANPVG